MKNCTIPSNHPPAQCPECDSSNLCESVKKQNFNYKFGDGSVTLSAEMPVFQCQDCNFSFTDERADRARQEAICAHKGIFSPSQIVSLRERIGMSRAELASACRFGIASLTRWENGQTLQNEANDQLLYLVQFNQIRTVLDQRGSKDTLLDDDALARKTTPLGTGHKSGNPHLRSRRRKRFRDLHNPDKFEAIARQWSLRGRTMTT